MSITSCNQNNVDIERRNGMSDNLQLTSATLAGGCFWCLEAMFSKLKGISNVRSGFSGGKTEHPTYAEVCTGNTLHAEVINFTYDPTIITFRRILEIFFAVHNPTTLNRQGEDVGTQYRSAIFYHTAEQQHTAQQIIAELTENHVWDNIVTEVVEFTAFYPADASHTNYYELHPENSYCALVVNPKVQKFYQHFAADLQ